MNNAVVARTVATPDGPFTIVATDDAVIASGWTAEAAWLIARLPASRRPDKWGSDGSSEALRQALAAVAAYYDGDFEPILAVPVEQPSAPFHSAARQKLREIPAGATASYSQLAAQASNPRAARAAAAACATNANALFVPCHRVIRGDGSLGGFLYGLPVKAALLRRESVNGSGDGRS